MRVREGAVSAPTTVHGRMGTVEHVDRLYNRVFLKERVFKVLSYPYFVVPMLTHDDRGSRSDRYPNSPSTRIRSKRQSSRSTAASSMAIYN